MHDEQPLIGHEDIAECSTSTVEFRVIIESTWQIGQPAWQTAWQTAWQRAWTADALSSLV
jgi:hypothetical protein